MEEETQQSITQLGLAPVEEPIDTHGPFSWASVKPDTVEDDQDVQLSQESKERLLDNIPQPMESSVALILPNTTVYKYIRYNMIASWAVDGDLFRAMVLKNQLWAFVNLYLNHPKAVQKLQACTAPLKEKEAAPSNLTSDCPPFGSGTFVNPRLAGVNPVAELQKILAEAETSKLADSITKAVLKGGPEYVRVIGERLASVVMEVRTARNALQAVLQERDALRLQLAEMKKNEGAAGEQPKQGAQNASSSIPPTVLKQMEAERHLLLNKINELEAEVSAWRATNSQQQQIGDRYAQLAQEYSRLEVDNTRLMQMLEENQGLLEEQMQKNKELESQLSAERATRQEAEAMLKAAEQQANTETSAEHLAHGRKVLTELKEVQTQSRDLSDQCSAVRAEAEALKTAVPLMGAYFEEQLKEFLASGGFASLQDAVAMYRKECRLRKQLYNQLMELRGNIRVYCRVRPLNERETGMGSESVVRFPRDSDDTLSVVGGLMTKAYEFDRVFQPSSTQEEVFEDTCPLVQSVMDGFNVCIFAYGQTGSGKTHTMEGTSQAAGVNYRAVQELFRIKQERVKEWDITITVSILEIYNETIKDLLLPDGGTGKLEVKQHPQGGVHVPGLTYRVVNSREDVSRVQDTARRNRTTFCTNMNEHSSRSHCLLSVNVSACNRLTQVTTRGKLHLVDLAGSERVAKSEAEGERLKEAQAINKSLAALGDVINALATKSAHVPFRNSKLTYALQDSLGGSSKVLMFVQVSPAADNVAETTCSLNFATRVRGVELGVAKLHAEVGRSVGTDAGSNDTPQTPGSPGNSGSIRSFGRSTSAHQGTPDTGTRGGPGGVGSLSAKRRSGTFGTNGSKFKS